VEEEKGEEETVEKKSHKKKRITPRESHFCKLMADTGMGGVEASRIAFGWRCEPGSAENDKARNLARSPRMKKEIKRHEDRALAIEKAKESMRIDFGNMHKGDLREYAFKVLTKMRDDPNSKAANRFNAVKMLRKLHDPGKDVNLIYRWIDLCWRYQTAHCPCCHESFALSDIRNSKLNDWRKQTGAERSPGSYIQDTKFNRQMEIIKRCDPRRTPHEGQILILAAPERHVVGEGAARSGKSFLLALFAAMGACLPGVEIWILAETYDRAAKEVDYLKKFLNTLFFPNYRQMFHEVHDKKTGELIITSKWGSEVRVKSSKSKGSITGHALEFALCAEPGWLPADIYEELRARMSERLGRIIALGTPKGLGGFIGRMTNMHGRDPKTGKMIRWKREDRLISNKCPWGVSMFITRLNPVDNPEFVKSELASARMELTDEEYASEFEGIGVSAEGAKFGLVRDDHLRMVEPDYWSRASFILGVDQGPKNFGACLVAYDGNDIVVAWEYFNSDERTTMKRNLIRLRARVPRWIDALGGEPARWVTTITDQDPMMEPIFSEMEEEGQPWPTDILKRHKNMAKLNENWRRENQEFINNTARYNHLWFHLFDTVVPDEDESSGAYLLHDQVRQCIDVSEDPERESKSNQLKGWQVSDPFRGDHLLDAWYFAMWVICSQQIILQRTTNTISSSDPWAAQKEQFANQIAAQEKRELGIGRDPRSAKEAWHKLLQEDGREFRGSYSGHYSDES